MLAGELGSATDTIAKLVQLSNPNPRQSGGTDDPARVWFDAIDDSTLVVIDEAGKARPIVVHTGISDGRMTEVTGEQLLPGMLVITDQLSAGAQ